MLEYLLLVVTQLRAIVRDRDDLPAENLPRRTKMSDHEDRRTSSSDLGRNGAVER